MYLKEINHLTFITSDMEKTIRFYRDLLGMALAMTAIAITFSRPATTKSPSFHMTAPIR